MKYFLILSTLLLSLSSVAAINLENAKDAGETNFLAVGRPAMIKIKGKAPAPVTKVKIENNKMSILANLNLNNFDTGIGLRDEHMKEKYLQTKEYPAAVLKIEKLNLPKGFEEKPMAIQDQTFEGVLNLHGKDQNVTGTFSLSDNLELIAHFSIKLTDFGIEIPDYLGINVADTVTIDTKFSLAKK
ncbi:MAG: YceI family protein [Bacteriovorax sp.]